MEPFCLLLLAGVSLPFAKALKGNETTPAESNLTSTTAGEDPAVCRSPALAIPHPPGRVSRPGVMTPLGEEKEHRTRNASQKQAGRTSQLLGI